MRDWTSLGERVYEVSIGVIDGSESDDSPISLGLKLCEVRVHKEVFGSICSRDVNMSGDDGLCVCMNV